MRHLRRTVIIIAALLITLTPARALATTTAQSIAIPAYSYPTTWTTDPYWDAVESSAVPWVIVNPSSGPGTTTNSDYQTQINDNQTAGIRNIGYVATTYQARPIADVVADIDRWHTLYSGVTGIMLDEIGDTNPDQRCYLASVYNYIKATYPNDLVIANPGAHISDAISPYADVFITSEMTAADYLTSYPAATSTFETTAANQNRIMHIVHATDSSDYAAVLAKTRQENAGWVYITDDVMPNPYDILPTNFGQLQTDVATLPATTIPDRGVMPYPTGCVVIESSATQPDVTVNDFDLQITNIASAAQVYRTGLRVVFTAPDQTSLSFDDVTTDWACDDTGCSYDAALAPSESTVVLGVSVAVACNVDDVITYQLYDSGGNNIGGSQQLGTVVGSVCPAVDVTDDTLAETGQPVGVYSSVAAASLLIGAALLFMHKQRQLST